MGSDVGQIFPTASLHRDHSISYALVCEKEISHMGKYNGNLIWCARKRIDHWCSMVPEKSQPSGPLFSGKLVKPRFPLEQWALGLGFFCPRWTPLMNCIDLTWDKTTEIPIWCARKKITVNLNLALVSEACFTTL